MAIKKTSSAAIIPSHPPVLTLTQIKDSVTTNFKSVALLLSGSPAPEVLVETYQLLTKSWKKNLEDLKAVAHAQLQKLAKAGDPSPADPLKTSASIGDRTVTNTVVMKKLPDVGKLSKLLAEKNLPLKSALDETITYTVNQSKLDQLVIQHKLTVAEIEACKDVYQERLTVE